MCYETLCHYHVGPETQDLFLHSRILSLLVKVQCNTDLFLLFYTLAGLWIVVLVVDSISTRSHEFVMVTLVVNDHQTVSDQLLNPSQQAHVKLRIGIGCAHSVRERRTQR